jgi:hypothetical protein
MGQKYDGHEARFRIALLDGLEDADALLAHDPGNGGHDPGPVLHVEADEVAAYGLVRVQDVRLGQGLLEKPGVVGQCPALPRAMMSAMTALAVGRPPAPLPWKSIGPEASPSTRMALKAPWTLASR